MRVFKKFSAGLALALVVAGCSTGSKDEVDDEEVLEGVIETPADDKASEGETDPETSPDPDGTDEEEEGEPEELDNHDVVAGEVGDFPKQDVDQIVAVAADFWEAVNYLTYEDSDPLQWLTNAEPYMTADYFKKLEKQSEGYTGGAGWMEFITYKKTSNVAVERVDVALDQPFDESTVSVWVHGKVAEQTPNQRGDVLKVGASVSTLVTLSKVEGEWLVSHHGSES